MSANNDNRPISQRSTDSLPRGVTKEDMENKSHSLAKGLTEDELLAGKAIVTYPPKSIEGKIPEIIKLDMGDWDDWDPTSITPSDAISETANEIDRTYDEKIGRQKINTAMLINGFDHIDNEYGDKLEILSNLKSDAHNRSKCASVRSSNKRADNPYSSLSKNTDRTLNIKLSDGYASRIGTVCDLVELDMSTLARHCIGISAATSVNQGVWEDDLQQCEPALVKWIDALIEES